VRFFNTAGPCRPERHYMLPAESRLPEARSLIDQEQYFVVHAPRQSGKTTTLATLARALTAEGRHLAVRFSCEAAEVAGNDYGAAEEQLLDVIRWEAASLAVPDETWPKERA
jgi:predicted AAA+ superfamily ATPase